MPFFSRILDFKRDFLTRLRNKRSQPRFPVGAGFPLKASLSLTGAEGSTAKKPAGRGAGLAWGGRVGDISGNGLSIMLPPAAVTARDEASLLTLTVEDDELVIPCTVAHFRVYNSHAFCGVRLEFDDFKTQKAYQQLVEAVSLGASFVPAGPARPPPGFTGRSWRSSNKALLTDWREANRRTPDRFELTLGEHSVQGRTSRAGLEVHLRADHAKSIPPAIEAEIRQLFRWVVGNLPKSVPADLRQAMTRAASNLPVPVPATWNAPATARALTSNVITVPASAWQSPEAPVTVG